MVPLPFPPRPARGQSAQGAVAGRCAGSDATTTSRGSPPPPDLRNRRGAPHRTRNPKLAAAPTLASPSTRRGSHSVRVEVILIRFVAARLLVGPIGQLDESLVGKALQQREDVPLAAIGFHVVLSDDRIADVRDARRFSRSEERRVGKEWRSRWS